MPWNSSTAPGCCGRHDPAFLHQPGTVAFERPQRIRGGFQSCPADRTRAYGSWYQHHRSVDRHHLVMNTAMFMARGSGIPSSRAHVP